MMEKGRSNRQNWGFYSVSILTAKQKSPRKIDIFQKLYWVLEVLPVTGLFKFFKMDLNCL